MSAKIHMMVLGISALCTFGAVQSGWAANFSVEPVRVVLDVQHQTERMVIKNESELPLTLLIKSYVWTQADDGTDRYAEAGELIVFPRALTLSAGEERFVRIGTDIPFGTREKAYRIFLEEQPIEDDQAVKGTSARLMMRVGIPVFSQALKSEPALKIKDLVITRGQLRHTLSNDGNAFSAAEQMTVNGVDDKGADVFTGTLIGGYLLAGSTRTFEMAIPKEQCSRISQISVTTRSEGKEQLNRLKLASGACEGK
jgi:fimbrial chaperone protein